MAFVPRPSTAACLLVLVAGCKGCQSEELLPTLLEAEDATAVGVWVGQGLGASPIHVPVYATNALGAAVPTETIALTSDGTVGASLAPDADGWALAEVSAPGRGRYGLGASVGGTTAEGDAWVVDVAPGGLDSLAAPLPLDPSQIARAADGIAWASGNEVWWSGWDGAPATRALALAEPVVTLISAEIDADGVTDLVVLSETHVALLRGRDAGGLVWGGGWTATEGRTITGASVADRDGDSVADLSLSLADGDGAWIYQMDGDGVWGFSAADALQLDYAVFGISVEDLDQNGVGEVTVLSEDGLLRRYTKLDGSWAATLTGSQFALETAAGARLWPATDLTGDGIPELVATGPSLDGTGWVAWVVTAGLASPSQFPIVSTAGETPYPWIGFAMGDLTGDGLADVAFTAPGRFTWAEWTGETFNLTARRDVPATALLELDDVDDDGIVDAVLGGETLRVLHGARDEDDPADPKDVPQAWVVRAPTPLVFGIHLVAEPVVTDVNGDSIVDVVGLVLPSGGTTGVALQGYQGVPATDTVAETIRSGGSVTLSGSGTPLALAVCDTAAYALYEEADGSGVLQTWLVRANLGAGLGPSLVGARIAVDGTALACGTFALGDVAVADVSGVVSYVDADGTLVVGESIGALDAMAAVDTDGDGLDELVACAEAGCVVATGDFDDDGVADLAVQDSTGTLVTMGGTAYALAGPGGLRVGDADGDTVADLLLGENGTARIVRGVSGGLTPAVGGFTFRPTSDAVRYGDLDGDALPDAFFFGADPDASDTDTQWVGTLLYARATE
ncbi:MAG: VCBS repeat-containing protein [Pseudomonadota bacterium]|nr:VCBS repeat-containing protein [Pseudomonadota bacterium]